MTEKEEKEREVINNIIFLSNSEKIQWETTTKFGTSFYSSNDIYHWFETRYENFRIKCVYIERNFSVEITFLQNEIISAESESVVISDTDVNFDKRKELLSIISSQCNLHVANIIEDFLTLVKVNDRIDNIESLENVN